MEIVKNLAIIKGNWAKISDGKVIYKASVLPKDKNESSEKKIDKDSDADLVTIRSDAIFGSGKLEFKIKIHSFNTNVLLILNSFDNREILCGYSMAWGQFLIGMKDDTNWKRLSLAGNLANYSLKEEINFKIEIKGSSINLFINEVLLCSANIAIKEKPIEFSLRSLGDFGLYDIKTHIAKQKIFVVMQFSNEYNELYEEVIKPVSEKFKFECIRADEFYTGTPILSDIIKSIQESTAIIAEITPDNPNVFYEIGYSHAIGKPTILLCDKKRDKLPFDLSSFRTLFYENTIAGKKKVENSLTKYLENI